MSVTTAQRPATSPFAPMSRWKMAENVCWWVTLKLPSAAIAMCTSSGSTPARKMPSACPRAMTRLSRSTIGRLSVRMAFDFFRWRPLRLVLRQHDAHEVLVREVVIEAELDDLPHRLDRRQVFEVEQAFGVTHLRIDVLEHRQVDLFLAAEVVVDHRPRGVGAGGDRVHARALEAAGGELVDRGADDARAIRLRRLRLAHRGRASRPWRGVLGGLHGVLETNEAVRIT